MHPETAGEGWLREVLLRIEAGEFSFDTIVSRPTNIVVRSDSPLGPSVLKLWNLSGAKGRVRSFFRHTKGAAEKRVLSRLARYSVPVPELFGHLHLVGQRLKYDEVLWMQDLGPVVSLNGLLHSASKSGRAYEVGQINREVIQITKGLIAAEIFDHDHRIGNFVQDSTDRTYRIDFENARVGSLSVLRPKHEGEMLGALLGSYAWISRYNPEFTREFIHFLFEELKPSKRTRRIVHQLVKREVRRYTERTGFVLATDQFL